MQRILVEGKRAVGVELRRRLETIPRRRGGLERRLGVDLPLPRRPRPPRAWPDWRIERSRYSMSLFVWYFGTKRKYEDVAHHTILLGPRYQAPPRHLRAEGARRRLLALPAPPTATDPSLAPENCDAFDVLSPVPHLDSGVDWRVKAEPYRKAVERYLSRTVMPGLADGDRHVADAHAAGFHDDLLSIKARPSGWSRCSRERVSSDRTTRAKTSRAVPRGRRHAPQRRGMPGVLVGARARLTVLP
ncbi:MAG: hypothetical protein R3A52_06285 [Polyangiales bacterium]